jgi:hypothetical protein
VNVFNAAAITCRASVGEDEEVGWRVDMAQGSKEKLLDTILETDIDDEEKAWKKERRQGIYNCFFNWI